MIDGAVHVLLIALRDIQPGETLVFDYNGLENMYPTDHFISTVCLHFMNHTSYPLYIEKLLELFCYPIGLSTDLFQFCICQAILYRRTC